MNKLSKFSFVTFTALFFFSLSTLSQEVEEVVVTATKKSESIQDIALSIEAFTSESIAENMIEDISDLAEVVPWNNLSKITDIFNHIFSNTL